MKVHPSVVLAFLASTQAADAFGGYGQGRKNRRAVVSNEHGGGDGMNEFKEKCQLKTDAKPFLQEIHQGGSFAFGDKEMSIDQSDLEPLDIFAPGAKFVVDGVEEERVTCVFQGKGDDDSLIALERNGNLVTASTTDHETGKMMNIVPVGDDSSMYATVSSDDVDDDMIGQFTMEDVDAPSGRSLRARFKDIDTRSLDEIGDCESYGYDVIDVAIVVDSYLCADQGGLTQVEALAQSIVAGASQMYQVAGLCKKLQISYLEIHCDPVTDPIRPLLDAAGTSNVCSGGLLGSFMQYMHSNGNSGDVNHLFHGKTFTGTSTVGCAFVGTLCDNYGYNSGVNEINFTTNPETQFKLLAHENAHICSARHIPDDRNDIMFPSLCATCNSFGSVSKSSINGQVASGGCTEHKGTTGTPAPAPTSSPDCNTFVLDLATDNYGQETSWNLKMSDNTIIESGSGYSSRETYREEYCVPDGKLTFTISDSYGDGICCGYGQGSYQITYKGNEVARGGQFTNEESVTFGGPGTASPTQQPTEAPTSSPTKSPTEAPTSSPTESPTYPPDCKMFVIDLQTDRYGSETSWELTTSDNIVIESGSGYSGQSTYREEYCVTDGEFTFIINDSYGDGICCSYGQGSYQITYDGKEVASGGQFAGVESVAFGGGPEPAPTDAPTLSPAQCKPFVLDLFTDNYGEETSWVLKTSDGTIVESGSNYSERSSINEEYCVPDEELTFTIYDSYGDGICCSYGQGSYQITYDGEVIANGGQFTNDESITFNSE